MADRSRLADRLVIIKLMAAPLETFPPLTVHARLSLFRSRERIFAPPRENLFTTAPSPPPSRRPSISTTTTYLACIMRGKKRGARILPVAARRSVSSISLPTMEIISRRLERFVARIFKRPTESRYVVVACNVDII